MGTIIERIKKEILSWTYVTLEPHRFGGIEFRFNKREMEHIHGERVADLPDNLNLNSNAVLKDCMIMRGITLKIILALMP
jgi:hypothetical protein